MCPLEIKCRAEQHEWVKTEESVFAEECCEVCGIRRELLLTAAGDPFWHYELPGGIHVEIDLCEINDEKSA